MSFTKFQHMPPRGTYSGTLEENLAHYEFYSTGEGEEMPFLINSQIAQGVWPPDQWQRVSLSWIARTPLQRIGDYTRE